WDPVPVPISGARAIRLHDIIALADDNVVAVGWRIPEGDGWKRESVAAHWNGTAWSPVILPGGPGVVSQLVKGTKNLWGIGSGPEHRVYIVVWSGSTWKPVQGPHLPGRRLTLHGGAILPGDEVLVAGETSDSPNSILPFAAVLERAV
ncbi:MAG: hypothetical protein ACREBW_08630, partial [Candidatus Micrarchaeaceae archaeon]